MQFGLGVLLSDGVGCGPDLVNETTGLLFPSGNAAAASVALQSLVNSMPTNRARYVTASRRQVENFTAARASAGIAQLARRFSRRSSTC